MASNPYGPLSLDQLRQLQFPAAPPPPAPDDDIGALMAQMGGVPVGGPPAPPPQVPAESEADVTDAIMEALGGKRVQDTGPPADPTTLPGVFSPHLPTKRELELLGKTGMTTMTDLVKLPFDMTVGLAAQSAEGWWEHAKGAVEDLSTQLHQDPWTAPAPTAEEAYTRTRNLLGLVPGVSTIEKMVTEPAAAQLEKVRTLPGETLGEKAIQGTHLAGSVLPVIGPFLADALDQFVGPHSTPDQRAEGLGHLLTLMVAHKTVGPVLEAATPKWLGGEGALIPSHQARAQAAALPGQARQYVTGVEPPIDPKLAVMTAMPNKRLNYADAADLTLQEVKAQENATGTTVTNLETFRDHLQTAMDQNREQLQKGLGQADRMGVTVGMEGIARATDTVLQHMEQAGYEQPPAFVRALETVQRYREAGDIPVMRAYALLQDLNAGLTEFYNQLPRDRARLLKTDPAYTSMKGAAEQLRDDLYDSLDAAREGGFGGSAARELQTRYGQMAQVMGRVNAVWNKALTENVKIRKGEGGSRLAGPFVAGGVGTAAELLFHVLGGHPVAAGVVAAGVEAGRQALTGRAARQVRDANSINGLIRRALSNQKEAATPVPWDLPPDIGRGRQLPPGGGPPTLDENPETRGGRLLPPGPGGAPVAPTVPTLMMTASQIRQLFGVDPGVLEAHGIATHHPGMQSGEAMYEVHPPGLGAHQARPVRTPEEVAGRIFYSGGGGTSSTLEPVTIEGQVVGPEAAARNFPGGPVATPEVGLAREPLGPGRESTIPTPLPEEQQLPPLGPGELPPRVDVAAGTEASQLADLRRQYDAIAEARRRYEETKAAAERGEAAPEMPAGPVETVTLEQPAEPLKALSGKVAREALARVRTRLDPKVFGELVQAWRDATQTKLKGSKWAKAEQTEPMVNWLRQEAGGLHPENPEYQRVVEQARRAVEDGLPPDYFPPEPPKGKGKGPKGGGGAPPAGAAPVRRPPPPPKGGAGGAAASPEGAAPVGRGSAPRARKEAAAVTKALEAESGPTRPSGPWEEAEADPTVLAHMREVTERTLGQKKWAAESQMFEDEGGVPGTTGEVEHLWNALADHLNVSREQAGQMLMSGELGGAAKVATPERKAPTRDPVKVVIYKLNTDASLLQELGAKAGTSTRQMQGLLQGKSSKFHPKAREIGERIIREEAAAAEPKPATTKKAAPVDDLALKQQLHERAIALDDELEHPFGDRDDLSALLDTATEDLTVKDLQAAVSALEQVQRERQRPGSAGKPMSKAEKPAPKSKAAAARETPRVIEVDPRRLEHGKWENNKEVEPEGDIRGAYSADRIGEKGSKIRKPVEMDGQLYTHAGTGDVAGSSTETAELWRLEPKATYQGKTHTYFSRPENARFTYQGMEVQWKGQTYVMTDPVIVRGTPRTVAEATAFMDKVRKQLSPEDQAAMDAEWKENRRNRGKKGDVDPEIVHQATRIDDLASHPATLRRDVTPQWKRIYDAVEKAAGRKVSERTLAPDRHVAHESQGLKTEIIPRGAGDGYDVVTSRGKTVVAEDFGYDIEAAREAAQQLHEDTLAEATVDAATKQAGLKAATKEAQTLKAELDAHTKKWQSLPMKNRNAYLKEHNPRINPMQDRYQELLQSVRRVWGDDAVEYTKSGDEQIAVGSKAVKQALAGEKGDAKSAGLREQYAAEVEAVKGSLEKPVSDAEKATGLRDHATKALGLEQSTNHLRRLQADYTQLQEQQAKLTGKARRDFDQGRSGARMRELREDAQSVLESMERVFGKAKATAIGKAVMAGEPVATKAPDALDAAVARRQAKGETNPESRYAGQKEGALLPAVAKEQRERLAAVKELTRRLSEEKTVGRREKLRKEAMALRQVYDATWSELEDATDNATALSVRAIVEGTADHITPTTPEAKARLADVRHMVEGTKPRTTVRTPEARAAGKAVLTEVKTRRDAQTAATEWLARHDEAAYNSTALGTSVAATVFDAAKKAGRAVPSYAELREAYAESIRKGEQVSFPQFALEYAREQGKKVEAPKPRSDRETVAVAKKLAKERIEELHRSGDRGRGVRRPGQGRGRCRRGEVPGELEEEEGEGQARGLLGAGGPVHRRAGATQAAGPAEHRPGAAHPSQGGHAENGGPEWSHHGQGRQGVPTQRDREGGAGRAGGPQGRRHLQRAGRRGVHGPAQPEGAGRPGRSHREGRGRRLRRGGVARAAAAHSLLDPGAAAERLAGHGHVPRPCGAGAGARPARHRLRRRHRHADEGDGEQEERAVHRGPGAAGPAQGRAGRRCALPEGRVPPDAQRARGRARAGDPEAHSRGRPRGERAAGGAHQEVWQGDGQGRGVHRGAPADRERDPPDDPRQEDAHRQRGLEEGGAARGRRAAGLRLRQARGEEMITITLLILLAAFVCLMAHVLKQFPLWVAVLLMLIVQLLAVIPLK